MSAHNRKYHRKAPFENAEKQKTHISFEICCFLLLRFSFSWLREVKNHVQEPNMSIFIA